MGENKLNTYQLKKLYAEYLKEFFLPNEKTKHFFKGAQRIQINLSLKEIYDSQQAHEEMLKHQGHHVSCKGSNRK